MRFTVSGSTVIPARREEVWPRLTHPHFLAQHASRVESVQIRDERHFTIISSIKMGILRVGLTLDVEFSDQKPPERLEVLCHGKAPGSALDLKGIFTLEAIASGQTRLSWDTDNEITGALAGVGAQLVDGKARKVIEDFWQAFGASIAVTPQPP